MAFGHRFGSEKKIAHCAGCSLGEGRKDIKFVLLPEAVKATDANTFSPVRRASARVPASVGKRPRLDHLWDVTHVSSPRTREPRRRALWRCARSARRDRGRGPDDHGVAGAVVA